MSQLLFNHPYRDSYNGQTIIPIRLQKNHSGDLVIYKYQGEETENVMSIEIFNKYCVPVIFKSVEGP